MPQIDIPINETESLDSSLSTSNGTSGTTSRSLSSRSNSSIDANHLLFMVQNQRTVAAPAIFEIMPRPRSTHYEPSLDAVLRQTSGSTDLKTLTHIQMRVSSSMFGLHQMHIFLPNLIALNLDGSSLNSLRDLGCELNKVKYLNVSRCGLRSLDGINGLNAVEHLVADDNDIGSVMQLSGLSELQTLSLRGNKIKLLSAVSFLSICVKLNHVDFTNNPITELPEYRHKVKEAIPNLLILDSFALSDGPPTKIFEVKISSSEYSSSLVSSSFSNHCDEDDIDGKCTSSISGNNSGAAVMADRPSSSFHEKSPSITIDLSQRPSTAESTTSGCTTGDALIGNIINKARRKRHQRINSENTNESSVSSLSDDALSIQNDSNTNRTFPLVLPQTTIELELGIIDLEPTQRECIVPEDAHKLIELARKWRETSRKCRITDD